MGGLAVNLCLYGGIARSTEDEDDAEAGKTENKYQLADPITWSRKKRSSFPLGKKLLANIPVKG